MKIEILFPTPTEARDFRRAGVGTHVSGVGIAATAYSTLKIIQSRQPDWLILAGVAGVYPHAGLKVGEDVEIVYASTAEVSALLASGKAEYTPCRCDSKSKFSIYSSSKITGISRLMLCSREMRVSVETTPGMACNLLLSKSMSCSLSRA